MTVVDTQRAMEPCAEAGYFGHYIHFDRDVDEAYVTALRPLGDLTFLRELKKPFFLLRGDGYILRGQVGDRFCKAGVAGNDPDTLARLIEALQTADV